MLTEHEQLADHEARMSRQELPPLQQPLDNIEQINRSFEDMHNENLRMSFIRAALTGICANITVNDMTTDHRSLCIDAAQIGNTMMEVLKDA